MKNLSINLTLISGGVYSCDLGNGLVKLENSYIDTKNPQLIVNERQFFIFSDSPIVMISGIVLSAFNYYKSNPACRTNMKITNQSIAFYSFGAGALLYGLMRFQSR